MALIENIVNARRRKREIRAQLWDDLLDLQREWRLESAEEFETLAIADAQERYKGIDPETLKLILEIIKLLAPIIFALFKRKAD